MAQNLTVKPAYLNNTQVMIDGVLTLLTNNLTQAQLLAIWQKPEYNSFIAIEYVNVQDSFPENFQIDPNLFNAYDSGQITHDKTKTNYPANTTGQYLNETRGVADATKNGLVSSATLPTKILDFAASKMFTSDCTFTRASVASYVDKYGTIKYAGVNQPRFTHDPLTLQSLGILIEESRTNNITNSTSVIENTTYIIKTSGLLAPDGSLTAINLKKNSTQNSTFFSNNVAISSLPDGFYVRSLFVKPKNTTQCSITLEGIGDTQTPGGYLNFDLNTKVFSGNTNIPYGYGYINYPDGWMRIWVVVEKSTAKIISIQHYIGGYGGTSSSDSEMLVWGFQLEEGKCVTSYIPTSTVAVTRANDIAYINNSSIPKLEGTFVATGVSAGIWEKSQGGYRDVLSIASLDIIGVIGGVSKITSWDSGTGLAAGAATFNDNIVLAYNQVSRKFVANGANIASGGFVSSILTTNNLYIGSRSSNFLNGTIKRLTFYSKMLPDSELIALSTKGRVSGFESASQVANSGLGEAAFLDVKSLMFAKNRQEFSIDGTGAAITRNIRRPYDFMFELVDTTGYTALTSQPPAMPTLCSANTNYPLTVTLPVGKTLTYCVYPVVY